VAAQTVIAAELDDDDLRMETENGRQAGDGVFGSGAAGALVFNLVAVAALIQLFLEKVGVRLVTLQAVSGGDAVAKTDQDGAVGGLGDSWEREREKRND